MLLHKPLVHWYDSIMNTGFFVVFKDKETAPVHLRYGGTRYRNLPVLKKFTTTETVRSV